MGVKKEEYLEMPWSVEDTIENLCVLKKAFQKKVIEINLDGVGDQGAKEVEFDFDRAIGALNKQIPKSPTYDGDGYAPDGTFVWDEWLCPCCGSRFEVEYEEHDYCPNCGQHILWEVEDEQ